MTHSKVDVLWITNDAILCCIPDSQAKEKAKGCSKYQKSELLISISRNEWRITNNMNYLHPLPNHDFVWNTEMHTALCYIFLYSLYFIQSTPPLPKKNKLQYLIFVHFVLNEILVIFNNYRSILKKKRCVYIQISN